MDALAEATDAAAAEEVDKEFQRQLDDISVETDKLQKMMEEPNFGDGIARVQDERSGMFLLQVKNLCCSKNCQMHGVPLVDTHRCDCCGYISHFLCQRSLLPTVAELNRNRVCMGCIEKLSLGSITQGSRCKSVNPNDDQFKRFLSLRNRELPLKLVKKATFSELKQQYEDGLMDVQEDDEETVTEDDSSTKDEDFGKLILGCPEIK